MAETKDKQHERALTIASAVATQYAIHPGASADVVSKIITKVYQAVRELDQAHNQK